MLINNIIKTSGRAFLLLLLLNNTLQADSRSNKLKIDHSREECQHDKNGITAQNARVKLQKPIRQVVGEREGLFMAALLTIGPSYGNKALTSDDLRRIFTYAFSIVKMTDSAYIPLMKVYAATIQHSLSDQINSSPQQSDLAPDFQAFWKESFCLIMISRVTPVKHSMKS